jgi:hypothetical protein
MSHAIVAALRVLDRSDLEAAHGHRRRFGSSSTGTDPLDAELASRCVADRHDFVKAIRGDEDFRGARRRRSHDRTRSGSSAPFSGTGCRIALRMTDTNPKYPAVAITSRIVTSQNRITALS